MNDAIRTTEEHGENDECLPEERRRAAAQILARGIRRLLTHAALAQEDAQSSSQPLENMEKAPCLGSRAEPS